MSRLQKASRTITGTIIKVMVYILIAAVVFLLAQKSFALGRAVFAGTGVEEAPGTKLSVVIMPDDSVGELAQTLYDIGLIEDKLVFQVQAFCFELKITEENAGVYILNTSQTGEEIIGQINAAIYDPEKLDIGSGE